ncbi:MAG: peptidase [Pirellulaceae bacterium]|nr:MAG: peptidase [Pirellulaceae bacterium]
MSTAQTTSGPPPLPARIQVQLVGQPARRWSRFFYWSLVIVLLLAVFHLGTAAHDYLDTTGGIQEKFHSGSQTASDKIAIIEISGLIVEGEGFAKKQIDRVMKDEKVKAVVVRIDSPGGTVSGADYLFHYLKKLREERHVPLVVSMGSTAASGGYYVAMAVGDQPQSIFAEPTTMTGSIGVMIPHYDISGLLQRFDITDDSLASHPRKLMLSMTRPMPDDHRQLLERQIDELFARFKEIVRYGRPALRQGDDNTLTHNGVDLATGEVFTAQQALQYGLVDQIGFLEDAIARAAALAGTTTDQVRVVRYRRFGSLTDILLGNLQSRAARDPMPGWMAALEWTVPRPYYLWSYWPPLLTTHQLSP